MKSPGGQALSRGESTLESPWVAIGLALPQGRKETTWLGRKELGRV